MDVASIDAIFPGWVNAGQIGAGAYGQVYRVTKETMGHTSEAAVKVIRIPRSDNEVRELELQGMDSFSIRKYFETTAKGIMDEIAIMDSLQGAENIVAIQDYKLIENQEGIGWTIWIRMELLESLLDYQERTGAPSVDESVKIAIDICTALDICHKRSIIHRDVKPENVFRSQFGRYKLGDFGIAKQLSEGSASMLSQRGTMTYMAPEIVKGLRYSENVDVYSLGIMLYRFLNDMRVPFSPAAPAPITQRDLEQAASRRLRGEALPAPAHATGELARIVLKACAAEPQERYASADEMRRDLLAWQREHAAQDVPAEKPAGRALMPATPATPEAVVLPAKHATTPPLQPEADTAERVIVPPAPEPAKARVPVLVPVLVAAALLAAGVFAVRGLLQGGAGAAVSSGEAATAQTAASWKRIAGEARVESAKLIVEEALARGAYATTDTVVLAPVPYRHTDFGSDGISATAAAAVSLAGKLGCPILEIELFHTSIADRVPLVDETLRKLDPTRVIVIGERAAFCSEMQVWLDNLAAERELEWLWADGVEATSREIAQLVGGQDVIVVPSASFTNAFTPAAYAYANAVPIVVADGTSLAEETYAAIGEAGFSRALVVGQRDVLAADVDKRLRDAGLEVLRFAASSECETSGTFSRWALDQGMGLSTVGVVSQLRYEDCVVAPALIGAERGTMLFVADNEREEEVDRSALDSVLAGRMGAVEQGYFFGGTTIISSSCWEYVTTQLV